MLLNNMNTYFIGQSNLTLQPVFSTDFRHATPMQECIPVHTRMEQLALVKSAVGTNANNLFTLIMVKYRDRFNVTIMQIDMSF